MNYPIEKYKCAVKNSYVDAEGVAHGPVVYMISHYAGEVVKGSAKCSPEDEFDLEYGKRLAAARCNEKVVEKRCLSLGEKLVYISHDLDTLQAQYNVLYGHLEKALHELNAASKQVYDIESEKMDDSEM